MAVLTWTKEVELENGTTASYWVAETMSLNLKNLTAQVRCEVYLDEASYGTRPPIIENKYYTIDLTPLSQNGLLATGVINLVKAKQNIEEA